MATAPTELRWVKRPSATTNTPTGTGFGNARGGRFSILEQLCQCREVVMHRDLVIQAVPFGAERFAGVEVLVGAAPTDKAFTAVLPERQPTLPVRLVAAAAVLFELAEQRFLHARLGDEGAELLNRETAIGVELRVVLLERREVVVPKRGDVLALCDVHSPPCGRLLYEHPV